ncbi:ABC transporter permease [Roseburia sp. MSJ-14]|uniref:ABC transporter permease n=1 Tax=Roseburia sp. MSJ-14 TaxID=2841514 RepID=UPI001C10F796|nr:iron ABC transporter permease [Roseburia sp. MSJ-14]MBU5473629.1 iron ABC transporter permease [Roseburia sp. MSJ-14]
METLKKGKKYAIHSLCYLLIILVFIAPIVRLFLMSLKSEEGYSLWNYALLLQEDRTRKAILNTIVIAVGSTAIAAILGSAFAFIIAYTNVRRKRLLELLVLLPFIIPSYIITLSWSSLFSQKGMINQTLSAMGLGKINVYSIAGIILVLGFCNVPIVYMNVIHMLRKIPTDMEWAARTCGYGIGQAMLKINLVQAMPAIISGSILAFLAAVDNFAVPAFLGISSGIPVLSTYIYEKSISFGPNSFSLAATLSVILSVIAVAGTLVEGIFGKKSSGMESIKEDYSVRIPLSSGKRKVLQYGVILFLCIINIVPLISMFTSAFQKNYGVKMTLDQFTTDNFTAIFQNKGVLDAIRNSLMLACGCCIICIVIGTAIAYQKVRHPGRMITLVEKSASLTYAIPGIVLALSMIFHWVEPLPGIRPGIYGTISILMIAYVTRYLILQIKGSATAMLSIHPALEEAAAASGRSVFAVWGKILIPLLIRPVLSSTFMIFVSALTELTLSSMLAAAGTKTIGLMIFNFQQAGDYNLAAAMSVVIVVLVLTGYFLINHKNSEYKKVEERVYESFNRKCNQKVQSNISIGSY